MKKSSGLPKIFSIFLMFFLICSIFFKISAEDKDFYIENIENIEKISKTLGHIIKKEIENTNIELDVEKVIEGLTQAKDGIESPLTKEQYQELISKILEKKNEEIASENLKIAQSFLENNAYDKQTIQLLNGKVQYQILKEGTGNNIKDYFYSPLLRIKGYLLDNKWFLAENTSIININELDIGLKKAIIGMKENEIRKIFIHPELNSLNTPNIPPNSLLIYEVEVIKVDKKKINSSPQNEIAESFKKLR